ncbi:MAG TPA: PilN domain-containing protein [candidate division Zixibacteria bacterium]
MIEINLLPKELRRGRRPFLVVDKTLSYMLIGTAVIIAFMVLIAAWQNITKKNLGRAMVRSQVEIARLQEEIKEVDRLNALIERINQRRSAIEDLDRNRSAWVDIMQDLSSRIPEYLWLSSFREEVAASSDSSAGSGIFTRSKVVVDGYAYSINSLASFIIQLGKSDYFKNIELKFVKQSILEQRKAFSFQLSGEILYSSEVAKRETENIEN